MNGQRGKNKMLTFAWPWLIFVAPLPWLMYRFMTPAKLTRNALQIPFFHAVSATKRNYAVSPQLWKKILLIMVWCSLLAASVRPQWTGDASQVPVTGRDMMMAVDISGSMKARDMAINGVQVNRLEAVKHVASDFISRRQGDRLGLILFGTHVYLQTPLSLDLDTVKALLFEAEIGIAGEKTAIGDAVILAIKKLRDTTAEQQDNILILLTDGTNTSGLIDPLKAAELARFTNLRIYTIGIGAETKTFNWLSGLQFTSPSTELDEGILLKMAEMTDGKYFRATDIDSLEEIYSLIDQFEPISQDALYLRTVEELFMWPLSFAMLATMVLAFLHVYLALGGKLKNYEREKASAA